MDADATVDERAWSMFAHLGILVLFFVCPLAIRQTIGRRHARVRRNATEALNAQLTFAVAWNAFGIAGMLVSPWFLAGAGLAAVLLAVTSTIGARRAWRGEDWRYPLTVRFLRAA